MIQIDLTGKVALVTGAGQGLGEATARMLHQAGATLALNDLADAGSDRSARLDQLAADLADRASCFTADVRDLPAIEQMVGQLIEELGGLDIVVNNAGIYIPGDSQDLSLDDWDRVVGLNLRAVFAATKFAVPHLRKSAAGRIINIASVHATRGGGGPAYAPAKAGLVNLTRDTAVEVAADGVTANAICPGYIETAIQDYLTPEQIETVRQRTPLPRFGTPKDIGRACVFLASDDASWITGVSLPVDGGWLAPIV